MEEKQENKEYMNSYILNESIEEITKDDEGYLYVKVKNKDEKFKLYHATLGEQYFMYYRIDGTIYIFQNKADIEKIINFIKSIEIKEEK